MSERVIMSETGNKKRGREKRSAAESNRKKTLTPGADC